MPRVNRDIQRRMEARRERERRRTAGPRRYQFAPPADEAADVASEIDEASNGATARAAAPAQKVRSRAAAPAAGQQSSTYREDYGYVLGDLRRIAVVMGGLLVALLVLYLVLPR